MAFRSNEPVMVALPPFRGVTRLLILAAVIVYFAGLVGGLVSPEASGLLVGLLTLHSDPAAWKLVWQFVTYPFVSLGLLDTLFALLTIWFFGSALESELGERWMREFFFVCTLLGGIAAALLSLVLSRFVEGLGFGSLAFTMWPFSLSLLLVFARLHPNQELNFNFILRVKAKYIAIITLFVYIAILLSQHQRFETLVVLTNALCGWAYVQLAPRRGLGFASMEQVYGVRNAWSRMRRRRAARRFTVYMQKQGRDVHFDESGKYIDPEAERRDPNDRKWMN